MEIGDYIASFLASCLPRHCSRIILGLNTSDEGRSIESDAIMVSQRSNTPSGQSNHQCVGNSICLQHNINRRLVITNEQSLVHVVLSSLAVMIMAVFLPRPANIQL